MQENKDNKVISSTTESQWVRYWESPESGERELELPQRYAVLLVLEGEVWFTFNSHDRKIIEKQSLVVIDRHQLTNFKWAAGTAMLEYTPPEKIFRFFACCSTTFQVPCSTIVPVYPPLQEWIDDLMNQRHQPQEMLTEALRREYCVRLGNILQNYPPVMVGELLVAFQACSMSGEKKCKGELCK